MIILQIQEPETDISIESLQVYTHTYMYVHVCIYSNNLKLKPIETQHTCKFHLLVATPGTHQEKQLHAGFETHNRYVSITATQYYTGGMTAIARRYKKYRYTVCEVGFGEAGYWLLFYTVWQVKASRLYCHQYSLPGLLQFIETLYL